MIVIGIDTGVNTGVSIWCQEKREITFFEAMPIHRALAIVQLRSEEIALVRVEDARKSFKNPKYITKKDKAKLKGVGSVMRDAKIWEDMLKDLDIPYQMIAPTFASTYKATRADPKRMNVFHKQFPKIPRLTKIGEDHIRDATHLCYGINKNSTKPFR